MNSVGFEKYIEYRAKYPEFIYHSCNFSETADALQIDYHFSIPGLAEFKPCWEITKTGCTQRHTADERLSKLIFSLGMTELVSYWKLTCSPQVRVKCAELTDEQIKWWMKLYKKGLGEFFYTNQIPADDDFMSISAPGTVTAVTDTTSPQPQTSAGIPPKVLVPIGGGKDSAVTLELIGNCADRYCYIINPRKATLDTFDVSGLPKEKLIIAKRTLDNNMLELNKQGYLNGHTPFSALVAFSSVLTAYIHGIEYAVLSNESTASEASVAGTDVNHQYSKSYEFETDFIEYEAKYVSTGVKYFSLLRPFTELTIAKIFSGLDKYHPVFRSCNAGSKEDKWCATCPKCLFVYIILAPFLSEDKMTAIFGKNLLGDTALLPVFEKLIGITPEKPFECVGSRKEVQAAVQEIIRQFETGGKTLPVLCKHYKDLGIREDIDFGELCRSIDEQNHVPEYFKETADMKNV